MLLDEHAPIFERYRALFGLRTKVSIPMWRSLQNSDKLAKICVSITAPSGLSVQKWANTFHIVALASL
jgi:hypothetical protein